MLPPQGTRALFRTVVEIVWHDEWPRDAPPHGETDSQPRALFSPFFFCGLVEKVWVGEHTDGCFVADQEFAESR